MLLELAILVQTVGHVNDATALTIALEIEKSFKVSSRTNITDFPIAIPAKRRVINVVEA